TGQVHERVIGLVEILLAAITLYPIPELDTTEAEGFGKLIGPDISAAAMIHTDARLVFIAAFARDVAHPVQLFDDRVGFLRDHPRGPAAAPSDVGRAFPGRTGAHRGAAG